MLVIIVCSRDESQLLHGFQFKVLSVHGRGRLFPLSAPVLIRAVLLPLGASVLVPRLDVLLRQAQRASQQATVHLGEVFLLVELPLEFRELRARKGCA